MFGHDEGSISDVEVENQTGVKRRLRRFKQALEGLSNGMGMQNETTLRAFLGGAGDDMTPGFFVRSD
jgi:hypothetical protein